MASTFSPILRIQLIGSGDQAGTWGDTTNVNLGTLLEQAIAGTATVDVTSGNASLTSFNGLTDQARCIALRVTGTPGVSRNIIAPAVSKTYIIANGSDGEVILKTSVSTGLTVPVGEVFLVYYDTTTVDFRIVGKASASANTANTLVLRDGSGNFAAGTITAALTGDVSGNLTGIINLTRGTIVQHATTMNLWALANTVDGTGSAVVITAITNAPQEGASRDFVPLVGTTITNNAMFAVQGNANYVSQAGDTFTFTAITVSTYAVRIIRRDSSLVPVGAIIMFASNVAPDGFLKANGAVINRTTYAALFASIGTVFGVGDGSTTFGLPDLRGEFLRGWDNARGIDSGRVFGTAQSSSIVSHNHAIVTVGPPGSGGSTGMVLINNGGLSGTITTYITAAGGADTLPRNIALLACIKF